MSQSEQRTRARLEMLEQEARNHSRRHAARLALLIACGYIYPLLVAFTAIAVLAALIALALTLGIESFPVLFIYGGILLFAAGMITALCRAFWIKLPPVDGHALRPDEGVALRKMIGDARKAVRAPKLHYILLDDNMNAAVVQRRRFGLWGPQRNYLIVGLPLLLGMTVEQFRAILIHELAHVRGGHGRFGARIWRIQRTWMTLAQPFRNAGRLRWLAMGWFIKWYGNYFATSTLAKRRIFEYESDDLIRQTIGSEAAARALIALSWQAHRLERQFWPDLMHEAVKLPMPPSDLLDRMQTFFEQPGSPADIARWRARELRTRTPITSCHPCMAERLGAQEMAHWLGQDFGTKLGPELESFVISRESAVVLLDDCRQRIWPLINARWKALQIAPWRQEHAAAKASRGDSSDADTTPDNQTEADKAWRALQAELVDCPGATIVDRWREFTARHPEHAVSSFTVGRRLMKMDDLAGQNLIETAMRLDSGYLAPGLHYLLEYYRNIGRDDEAEQYRLRLAEYESHLEVAKKERQAVGRRDRFIGHDLSPRQVDQLRRLLIMYPQILSAHLARKTVNLFADKSSYVLAINRRHYLMHERRSDDLLVKCLRSQINLSCAVAIVGRTPRSVMRRIIAVCPEPVFLARG